MRIIRRQSGMLGLLGLVMVVAVAFSSLNAWGSPEPPRPTQSTSKAAPFIPPSGRRMTPEDLAALKLTPDQVETQTIRFLVSPEQAREYFDHLMGARKVRLATAGYSAPPPGYEEPTRKFLDDLAARLKDNLGLVTSPTADKGSIDAISSEAGNQRGLPIGYVTADAYLQYVNPDKFPPTIDKQRFAAAPKFSLPDGAEYSRATAVLSNSILITGGRNAAVSDFMNAIRFGHKAVVLTNADIPNPPWDPARNRVDNASAYLAAFASGNTTGIPMDHPFNQVLRKFWAENRDRLNERMLRVDAADPRASQKTASFLMPPAAPTSSVPGRLTPCRNSI